MAAFRRVEDRQAGPSALGILVPPGRQTVVILRPRAVGWDLLALRPDGEVGDPAVFGEFEREEAACLARQVQQDLVRGVGRGANPVETVAGPASKAYRLCVRAGGRTWLACLRLPGQPYRPADFPTLAEAQDAARRLARFLHPAPEADQEFYFNTQNFSR